LEIVLKFCESIATAEGSRPLASNERKQLQEASEQFQSRGMRTLAFAYRTELAEERDLDSLASGMIWLGFVAIADPVRPEVPAAIAACRSAGVQVKIVTGDSVETAREIGRQVGLDDAAEPLTGPEFAALSDEKASEAAAKLTILARARPADKLRLVKLLKARGEVVAVTGDGVNDGPALNFADVGLAMGRTGTAVAREASDIILLDDSFPSIVSAIRWGRSLYENIQRFILFQLTINVVALGLAVLGPFLGYELPLTVMQMLWVNLIMDTFAALALATEPPNDAVLDRPPRSPKAFIVTPRMAREIFGVGAAFLAGLVGLIVYWQSTDQFPSDDVPSRAGTKLFTIFVLLQFWNLFNAKALGRRGSVLPTLGNNPSFLAIAAAILLGQVLLVQFGGEVFRTVPLSAGEWLALLLVTSFVLLLGEAWRVGRKTRC
jgi:Ca2+-transporting ATPase